MFLKFKLTVNCNARLILLKEQEIFVPLMIKTKVIPVHFKNHDLKFTQVDFTGTDIEHYYYMLKFSSYDKIS